MVHVKWAYPINLGQNFLLEIVLLEEDKCQYLIIKSTIDLNVLVEPSKMKHLKGDCSYKDTFNNHLAEDLRSYFCLLRYIYGPGSDLMKSTVGKTLV